MAVAVAEAEHVAQDGDSGRAAGVGEAFVEPAVGAVEALGEEVA